MIGCASGSHRMAPCYSKHSLSLFRNELCYIHYWWILLNPTNVLFWVNMTGFIWTSRVSVEAFSMISKFRTISAKATLISMVANRIPGKGHFSLEHEFRIKSTLSIYLCTSAARFRTASASPNPWTVWLLRSPRRIGLDWMNRGRNTEPDGCEMTSPARKHRNPSQF